MSRQINDEKASVPMDFIDKFIDCEKVWSTEYLSAVSDIYINRIKKANAVIEKLEKALESTLLKYNPEIDYVRTLYQETHKFQCFRGCPMTQCEAIDFELEKQMNLLLGDK